MILTAGAKSKQAGKNTGTASGFDPGIHFKAALIAVFNVVLILSIIFGIATARIYLNGKIDKLDNESNKLRAELQRMQLETENLRVRREKLSSWTEIGRRIRKFGLPLRAPRHYQVKQLAIVPYNLGTASETETTSKDVRLTLR